MRKNIEIIDHDSLIKDSVLRVGEVSAVDGIRISIKVDKNKNQSHLFFNGDILTNISVNSFIEIKKGFLSIIGKVDGEKIDENKPTYKKEGYDKINKSERFLLVSLVGYIDIQGSFISGTREFPLIGNEAYVVTRDKIMLIYSLSTDSSLSVNIATTEDDIPISLPVDKLFNSHIAIFGNTGSGKSNTLAHLYQQLCEKLSSRNKKDFLKKSRFILFDFNGEYHTNCIAEEKYIYNLSTKASNSKDKIPISEKELFDVEFLSVIAKATENTQKPFLKRVLKLYNEVFKDKNNFKGENDPTEYFKNILRKQTRQFLKMTDKNRVRLIIDYMRNLLGYDQEDVEEDITSDLDWHNQSSCFIFKHNSNIHYLDSKPEHIVDTKLYNKIDSFKFPDNPIEKIIFFSYLQLINDILVNRAQNEHIAPFINRLGSRKNDIAKLFDTSSSKNLFPKNKNFVVINLNEVNLDMKKTIPLLLSKIEYSKHKKKGNKESLNIILDEAHNILSTESFREAESWKDYRLETFEEIIKEGRKFGVFLTISSQRPNDISQTIISQVHNYFIHRLVNQKDLATIAKAVSYIDKVAEESIPTLPIGTCIFSGVAGHMPLKIKVAPLLESQRPESSTLKFEEIISKS